MTIAHTPSRRHAIAMAAMALLPASFALAGPAATSQAAAAKAKKYNGPVTEMRWGPVQAQITVKNKKITVANIAVSVDTDRSQFIDEQAIPILRQETLRAQSANIDVVSGATMTSEAYIESLQSAIKAAKKQKQL